MVGSGGCFGTGSELLLWLMSPLGSVTVAGFEVVARRLAWRCTRNRSAAAASPSSGR